MLVCSVLSERESNQTNPGRPTMCRNCKAIVGAGETQCAVCGTPTSDQPTSAAAHRQVDRETLRFARAVLNRPYKFTIIFLVANLFLFLLMWESSGLNTVVLRQAFDENVLTAYGAKQNYLMGAPYYQWWRFIAPMFLHVNLLHLFVNMYSLMAVGPFVEKLYGSAKFVVFWVLTGICGLIASYATVRPHLATNSFARFIFKAEDVPSAGASGALFGLVGVLFVFGIKFRHELPEGFKRAFGTGMLPIIFINLIIGFIGQGFIDNAAHLGGLLSGAVLALGVNYQRPGVRRTITNAWRVLQFLVLLVVLGGFYKVARNFNSPVPQSPRAVAAANRLIFLNYVNLMHVVQEQASAIIHHNDKSGLTQVIDHVKQAPAPDQRARELKERVLVILTELGQAAPATGPASQLDQKVVNEYKQWQKDFDQWFKSAVKTYTFVQ
ncbi:MAG TPA: rhomboid family intramembrane serine protease [Pyrinomonadaceae bacterium]|nr:rhomboid family intramembrane serine protease [Pyrinomonadaceae bacterium]